MIMEELLQHLERQIRNLIGKQDDLHQMNQELHQSKQLLLIKQQQAAVQIESLLSKLKSIEKIP